MTDNDTPLRGDSIVLVVTILLNPEDARAVERDALREGRTRLAEHIRWVVHDRLHVPAARVLVRRREGEAARIVTLLISRDVEREIVRDASFYDRMTLDRWICRQINDRWLLAPGRIKIRPSREAATTRFIRKEVV